MTNNEMIFRNFIGNADVLKLHLSSGEEDLLERSFNQAVVPYISVPILLKKEMPEIGKRILLLGEMNGMSCWVDSKFSPSSIYTHWMPFPFLSPVESNFKKYSYHIIQRRSEMLR